jgi:hypothetical protein
LSNRNLPAVLLIVASRPGDRLHRPWRFGSSHEHGERGYSDHFPVTVRLRVQP